MASELKPSFEFDRYINGTLMAEGVTIERASKLDKAMVAAARIAPKGPNGETPVLVYRPAPAATDTGLETVGEVSTVRESVAAFAGHMLSRKLKPGDLLCLRSQAEELLAAEIRRERDLAEKQLSEVVDRMSDDYLALKAELDQAVGVIEDRSSEYEALEAKLAAAEKALGTEKILADRLASALEYIDDYSLSYPDLGTITAVAQPALKEHSAARAVLGGKPS
ncbi:hypothetical protein [Brucella intermedia]|uniref:hypothetical protein n=1 Tax=Brucella intermedia TaxID=94625 RepID=UPI00124D1486|nr:hypothetical protein [Brucella intermedia]KAB2693363.1 hypothetical protein F9K72_18015 [Brucella intermedia]